MYLILVLIHFIMIENYCKPLLTSHLYSNIFIFNICFNTFTFNILLYTKYTFNIFLDFNI